MRVEPAQCANPACACKPEADSRFCSVDCETGLSIDSCLCRHEICVQARQMAIEPEDPLIKRDV